MPLSALEISSEKGSGGGLTRSSLGNSLIALVVGAIILWVGQTTFQHSGKLAGVDHQLKAFEDRHTESLERYDELLHVTAERTRSRFTREDGELLLARIKEGERRQRDLNQEILEKLSDARARIAALDVHVTSKSQVSVNTPLWTEIQLLRAELAHLQRVVDNAAREAAVHQMRNAAVPSIGSASNASPAPYSRVLR